jgi:biofilm PGA synthesis N-glycosyltransferase PgaC
MTSRSTQSLSLSDYVASIVILAGAVLTLLYLLPTAIVALGAVIVGISAAVYGFVFAVFRYRHVLPGWLSLIPIWLLLFIPVIISLSFVFYFRVQFSLVNGLIFVALLLLISVYWTVTPAALNHYFRERGAEVSVDEWPSISVLIPAHNESEYVGPCIESFLNTNYPEDKLDIIVIDDGSTDETFAQASEYSGERVTVLQQENAGKHAAMNHGLDHVSTDLVIGVDADSRVEPDAVTELVQTYESKPGTCAVAGNVKVENRKSLLTKTQALEYIVSINMFRRAFDQIGLVKVVPGCLGLFDREQVEAVGGFSGDTVTEDFDLTIELLKDGGEIHYSSKAIVRTEVPDTWRGLYSQRLRWFRGTIQTAVKHRSIFFNPRFGLVHGVLAPFLLLSIGLIPFLGMVVLGTILYMAVFGSLAQLLGVFVIFVLLESLFSTVAIRIENTVEDESLWLVLYAPLLVVGYKQFQDMIMIRSLFDVLAGRELGWTNAERVRQRDELLEEVEND